MILEKYQLYGEIQKRGYSSTAKVSDESWSHKSIVLKPASFDSRFKEIVLEGEDATSLKVIGEFVTTLDI
mgnify:CR=1 FL=1